MKWKVTIELEVECDTIQFGEALGVALDSIRDDIYGKATVERLDGLKVKPATVGKTSSYGFLEGDTVQVLPSKPYARDGFIGKLKRIETHDKKIIAWVYGAKKDRAPTERYYPIDRIKKVRS